MHFPLIVTKQCLYCPLSRHQLLTWLDLLNQMMMMAPGQISVKVVMMAPGQISVKVVMMAPGQISVKVVMMAPGQISVKVVMMAPGQISVILQFTMNNPLQIRKIVHL